MSQVDRRNHTQTDSAKNAGLMVENEFRKVRLYRFRSGELSPLGRSVLGVLAGQFDRIRIHLCDLEIGGSEATLRCVLTHQGRPVAVRYARVRRSE